MTKVLLFLIKLVQGLMLLSAMAAFGYGAFHLSQATWWRFAGETVAVPDRLRHRRRCEAGAGTGGFVAPGGDAGPPPPGPAAAAAAA